jgi:hypothetical protein
MFAVEIWLKLILDRERFVMGNSHSDISKELILPWEIFSAATFKTCSEYAMVTWVVTGVLCGLFLINT